MRLLHEEKRCRRDEVCAGTSLASTQSHEGNLEDLREILVSLAPALAEPGLRQLVELRRGARASGGLPPRASGGAPGRAAPAGRRPARRRRHPGGPRLLGSSRPIRLGGALVPILELPICLITGPWVGALQGHGRAGPRPAPGPQEGAAKPDEQSEGKLPRAIIRVLPTLHGERLDIHLGRAPPRPSATPGNWACQRTTSRATRPLGRALRGLILHAGLSARGKTTALLAGAAAAVRARAVAFFAILSRPAHGRGGSVRLPRRPPARERRPLFKSVARAPPRRGPALDDLGEAEAMGEALRAAGGGLMGAGRHGCDGVLDACAASST